MASYKELVYEITPDYYALLMDNRSEAYTLVRHSINDAHSTQYFSSLSKKSDNITTELYLITLHRDFQISSYFLLFNRLSKIKVMYTFSCHPHETLKLFWQQYSNQNYSQKCSSKLLPHTRIHISVV